MMKNSKKKGILIAVAVAVIVVIAVAAVCLNRKTDNARELSAKAGQSRMIKQKSRIKLIKKNQRTKEIQMRRL